MFVVLLGRAIFCDDYVFGVFPGIAYQFTHFIWDIKFSVAQRCDVIYYSIKTCCVIMLSYSQSDVCHSVVKDHFI